MHLIDSLPLPPSPASQNLKNREGTFKDGVTTLKFSRKRDTGDRTNDVAFTDDDDGFFFIFPVFGGPYNAAAKKIDKHSGTPTASVQRIKVKACRNGELIETIDVVLDQGSPLDGVSKMPQKWPKVWGKNIFQGGVPPYFNVCKSLTNSVGNTFHFVDATVVSSLCF